jgi:hypothetical protein
MRRFVALAFVLTIVGGFLTLGHAASAKSACLCVCSDSSTAWSNLSPGNQNCVADCSLGRACNGRSQLKDPETGGILIKGVVTCVPGSNDCAAPPFNIYKGVSCVEKEDTQWAETYRSQNYPQIEPKRPTCVVPVTAENAKLECANVGGIAKGGDCGKIEEGGDPNLFFKSRPDLGKIGTDFARTYANFDTWHADVTRGHTNNEIHATQSHTDGICYRFGVLYGGVPQYQQDAWADDPSQVPQTPLGAVPSNEYLCLKTKRDTCGTVQPPSTQRPILPARAYTCQLPSSVSNPSAQCFTGADLCASKPGTQCCQGGAGTIGECLFNSECSSDGSMICSNGQCVKNVVCDPIFGNDPVPEGSTEPWRYNQRRCRNATDAEKANSSICSPDIGGTRRCVAPGQSCCRAVNEASKSPCASDFALEAGVNSVFNDFVCVPTNKIPESQYITFNGQRSLAGFSKDKEHWQEYQANATGPHCLTSVLPKYEYNDDGDLVLTQSVPRCGASSVCCNSTKMEGGVVDRQGHIGDACGGTSNTATLYCRPTADLLPTNNAEAESLGYISREDYVNKLIAKSQCQFTPFPGGTMYGASQECEAGGICCYNSVPDFADSYCDEDTPCCSSVSADECELECNEFHMCQVKGVAGDTGESCLTAAAQTDYGSIAASAMAQAYPPETIFSCQLVNTGAVDLDTKCLPVSTIQTTWGCFPSDTQGKDARCCIPGVGATASSNAQNKGVVPPAQAPFSLRLPACIQSGRCELPDIIATGANFANFLLQIVGAVFLAIFVYGGLKYLTAGTSGRAKTAREMLITATKALALIFSAYVFIQFVQTSLVGGGSGACMESSTSERPMSCQYLQSAPDNTDAVNKEISDRACVRNLCQGPENFVCCPS